MHSLAQILCIFAISLTICHGAILVDPSTSRLVDGFGRERLFHGVNVVFKEFPYFPITDHYDFRLSFSAEDMAMLQEWGMNVVRLAVMWPGVEPTQGEYNETYLDIVEQVVANMNEYGLYALIECHQDLMSEKFCGEGVPLWAAQPEDIDLLKFPMPVDTPYSTNSEGIPDPQDCAKRAWSDYYPTVATSSAFQRLYDNDTGLLESFANYWKKLASIFVKYDNVIGYELLNEPWAGDIFLRPDLLIPTVADKKNLAPMYEVLNSAIREVDNTHMIFFESVTWDDWKVGFDSVPGGGAYQNRSVLSYHIYIPPAITIADAFHARNDDITRLSCGGFLTEFEICQSGTNLSSIVQTADLADSYLQSWIAWEYKIFINYEGAGYCMFSENGTLIAPLLQTLSRTYPTAVAGKTSSVSYSDSTKQFGLAYESDNSISEPTVIYLNEKLNYPNGYSVFVTPNEAATWNATNNFIYVWNVGPGDSVVTVTIQAK